MFLITRRLATGLLLVPFAGIRLAGDAPVMAIEVIDYIKDIGTVRTGVDGRIVVK